MIRINNLIHGVENMYEKSSKSNQSVEKAMQIIEVMAEARGPMRLQDIAGKTSLPSSTALRMVNTLVKCGYAYQDQATLKYGLTLQFARIGSMVGSQLTLRELAHPIMEELSAKCKESSCLAIEQGQQVVYIDLVEGPDSMLRIMQRIGKRAPMHCTGIGKLLLLNYSLEELDHFISTSGMEAFTANTITEREALLEELKQVRAQGWAIDDEECEVGARCIAAGIYDYTGRVIAGISVSGPTTRIDFKKCAFISEAVTTAARQISQLMGYHG